ncbi:hypothetical protein Salat_0632100 [Sesamum alatum]|uniref:Uncharacterized protein n=1 Tax=Sesamum alatum TaxID=300844 RepID=A0AAE1YRJ9_9LAMI|nr:hypothetical protein Salat_0632100 [Sesamum alatum]
MILKVDDVLVAVLVPVAVDRVVVADLVNLRTLFPNSEVHNLPTAYSDHSVILIRLSPPVSDSVSSPCFPFRFEASWARLPECSELISDSWIRGGIGSSDCGVVGRLNHCSEVLESWWQQRLRGLSRRRKWLERRICELESARWTSEVSTELSNC